MNTPSLHKLVTTQLANKRIVILGIGITGLSCARFLYKHQLSFVVNDSRATPISPGDFKHQCGENKLVLGHWDFELIRQAQVLIVSPGIDMDSTGIRDVVAVDCDIVGDIELYCRFSDTPILAVTGSNGKSTVVSMLNHVGNELGYKVQLGGNIGLPVLDQLNEEHVDFMVLELSSFQLETITSMRALGATVLNVSDDHLDRHKTMQRYGAIKRRIYQGAKFAVCNREDDATLPTNPTATLCSFGVDEPEQSQFGIKEIDGEWCLMQGHDALVRLHELPLQGIHNALNYLAVLALGCSANWSTPAMLKSLKNFNGLAHRCEVIATTDGIRWINDSKATNVGATLAAIEGLAPTIASTRKLILIAGGDGKGADFSPLKKVLNTQVFGLITLGKDGDDIAHLRDKVKCDYTVHVNTLPEAVALAREWAENGDMVLLSPACASIDMFANYVERGVVFIKSVLMAKERS